VSVVTIYDDNLFAKANGDAGAMTLLRPSLEGLYESPTLTIQSLFSFDMQRSNHADLTMLDARRHGDFDSTSARRRKSCSARSRYDRTETPRAEPRHRHSRRAQNRGPLGSRAIAGLSRQAAHHADGELQRNDRDARRRHPRRAARPARRVARQTSTRDEISVGYLGREFVDSLEMHRSNVVLVGWSRELAEDMRSQCSGPRQSTGKGLATEALIGFTRNTDRLRLRWTTGTAKR